MENPEAHVWAKTNGEMIKYNQALSLLKYAAQKAGIKKRIYPHLFRHSRATFLARHMTESQMKTYLGWVQGSDMAGVYVHMSGRDVDDTLLKIAGIEKRKPEKTDTKLEPMLCDRCKMSNPYTYKFCLRCGFILDDKERFKVMGNESDRKKADNILDQLLNDDEFKELFINKLQSLQ